MSSAATGSRTGPVWPLAVFVTVAAVVAWFVADRGIQFFHDEWSFVLHPPANAGAYFLPHNEHWSTVPLLIYQAFMSVFGIRTHLPYIAVVVALHGANALMLFRLVRRRSGNVLAFAGLVLLLTLSPGSDDFLWPFQIAWQISALGGLAAMDLLGSSAIRRWPAPAAGLALLVSMASSGIGVAFGAAAVVDLVCQRSRHVRLLALLPAWLSYAVWFAVVGHTRVHPLANLASLPTLARVLEYVLTGVGAATAGLLGQGQGQAGTTFPLVVALGAVTLLGPAAVGLWRRIDHRILGAAAGLVTLFVTAGLERAQLGVDQATSPRYVYIAAIFIILLVSAAVPRLPWLSPVTAVLVAAAAIGVLHNVEAASLHVDYFETRSFIENTELETLNDLRGAARIDLDARVDPDPALMPEVTPGLFFAAEDRVGSPVPAVSIQRLCREAPALVDQTLRNVLIQRVGLRPGSRTAGCGSI